MPVLCKTCKVHKLDLTVQKIERSMKDGKFFVYLKWSDYKPIV